MDIRRPALRNSVYTEHRFLGLDAGDRDVSRADMDTESCSELPRLYLGAEAEDVAPRMHLGEPRRDVYDSARALRVNMIRALGEDVEVTEEEPRFGGSRAAPLQGADCGRPSRSANEGGANDENDESETEGRPRACRRHRRLPEVPYSTASSEERYHGTDGGSRSRAKTPETNSKTNKKTSTVEPLCLHLDRPWTVCESLSNTPSHPLARGQVLSKLNLDRLLRLVKCNRRHCNGCTISGAAISKIISWVRTRPQR